MCNPYFPFGMSEAGTSAAAADGASPSRPQRPKGRKKPAASKPAEADSAAAASPPRESKQPGGYRCVVLGQGPPLPAPLSHEIYEAHQYPPKALDARGCDRTVATCTQRCPEASCASLRDRPRQSIASSDEKETSVSSMITHLSKPSMPLEHDGFTSSCCSAGISSRTGRWSTTCGRRRGRTSGTTGTA